MEKLYVVSYTFKGHQHSVTVEAVNKFDSYREARHVLNECLPTQNWYFNNSTEVTA